MSICWMQCQQKVCSTNKGGVQSSRRSRLNSDATAVFLLLPAFQLLQIKQAQRTCQIVRSAGGVMEVDGEVLLSVPVVAACKCADI